MTTFDSPPTMPTTVGLDRLVAGDAAWYGRDLCDRDDWIEVFDESEIAELEAVIERVELAGLEILDLDRSHVTMPNLQRRLARLSGELDGGRGFVLLRGLPIERLTVRQAAIAYWAIGLHLGTPVSQNARGHLLGHVTDEGLDIRAPGTRGYQTRVRLPYHTDSSDVVGLLCLRPAKSGGLSSLASSTTVFNETLERRPDLAHLWFEPWFFDRRNEERPGEDPFFQTQLAARDGDQLSIRYVRSFMETVRRHEAVPPLTDDERAFLDLVDTIVEEDGVALHMDFRPGDIQFVCNYTIMHSRTSYEDWPEPERRRHLLRLWLTLHEGRPLPDDFGRGISTGVAGRGGIAPVPALQEAGAGTRFS